MAGGYSPPCIVHHLDPLPYSDTSFKPDMDSQPALKKRKISPSGAATTQPLQSSFADVLQRLKEDANEAKGAAVTFFVL